MPICIVVKAEIKEDRVDEFLDMIEKNAVGSREEPGCRIYHLEAEKAMKTARKHKKTPFHNI
eukprot:scaffold3530_cov90-Skeletonema_dohrnii-CCMP3373.AAC.2